MDFKTVYNEFLSSVEKRIKEYVIEKEPNNLYEPIAYIMASGGKRIRPILTMIACGAVSEKPYLAINAGVALEILHNFTLVHDDIMDESPLRRGRQTVHVKWNSAIAILAGDAMIGMAYKILPCDNHHKRTEIVLQTFTNEIIEVCEGQVLDMDFNSRKDVSMDDYMKMIDKKTAKLLEACVVIGANLGEASADEITALRKIAHNVGIAFQIQDDLLDLTADVQKLGKRIGGDIIEGKKTFFVIKARELAKSNEDIELLNKFYEENGLEETYVSKMVDIFERLGIIDLANQEINKLFDDAYSQLNYLKKNQYVDMLKWLMESIQNRKF